ncbi:MAG: polysaccharide biosynthesis protein [Deferribacteres bacterium]|nr:polysaccharide biosynthesis protein [Deferribacteres bacterium]
MSDNPTRETSVARKIIRNTFFNIIGRLWGILAALLLTPYIIERIGIERYGIWAITGVVTGYFGLLDFGIGTSFVKYMAEHYTIRDFRKINEVVNTGFVFYSVVAVLIILPAYYLVGPLVSVFNIPHDLRGEAEFVFLLGIILFAVSGAMSPFAAVQGGLQRMDITNKAAIGVSAAGIIGTVAFLEAGWGLPGLMINNAIMLAVSSIVNICIAFRILPELKFNPMLSSPDMFRRLAGFGVRMQIARIASMVSVNMDKLLIGYFLSIGLVAFYQLGSSIVEKTKSVALLFLSALVPAFSEIDASGGREKLIEGYLRGTKYLALISVPLFVFVIISAPQIMKVWMGDGYEKSAWIIRIIGAGWLCAVLAGVRGAVVQAIARPGMEMRAGLVAVALNLPLSIIFITHFGFMGVAFGTLIALFFSAVYGFVTLHREIRLPLRRFRETSVITAAAVCITAALPVYGLTPVLSEFAGGQGRMTGLVLFIAQAVLFFGVYLAALLYIRPLNHTDVMLLAGDRLPAVRRMMARFSK